MKIGERWTALTRRFRGLDRPGLSEEDSGADAFGLRSPWNSSEITAALSPESLASLVTSALGGSAHDYLTLAEEMEERDLHYRSVLGTRKHAIESIIPIVEPGGEDSTDQAIAADLRATILDDPRFSKLVKDALDGLGKGYSVNEIIWETTADKWKPARYEHRDPRWFEYDRITGRRLLLREGAQLRELSPFKYIIHEPHLKSGLPIRGGLALPVAYYFLIKNYDLAGWAAFADVYGYPLRIGRYDGRAKKEDKDVLRSALRNIGRDIGAMIPKGMEIEIINGVGGKGNIDLFEKLANWVDKQVSKGVLGQTMSTDAEGGQYKGDLHNEVRQEIRESDAGQLAATLNRDLIQPYVNLNYGLRDSYPILKLPVPRPQNIPALVDAVKELVPLGFQVKSEELYSKLGLSQPGKNDAVLTQPKLRRLESNTKLNRQNMQPPGDPDALAAIQDEVAQNWMEVTGPIRSALNRAASECESFDEMLEKLPSLIGNLATENTAGKIASATWKARALGDADFEDE